MANSNEFIMQKLKDAGIVVKGLSPAEILKRYRELRRQEQEQERKAEKEFLREAGVLASVSEKDSKMLILKNIGTEGRTVTLFREEFDFLMDNADEVRSAVEPIYEDIGTQAEYSALKQARKKKA